jgi:hypothetical protein
MLKTNKKQRPADSVYNQLLYVPVPAYKVSFSTNKVVPLRTA